MNRCLVCKDYPEGTACSLAGCPGRAFKLLPTAAQPDDIDAWLEGINADLIRDIEQNESVSFHIGGSSK